MVALTSGTRDQVEAFDPAGCAGELHRLLPDIADPVLGARALHAWIIGYVQRGDREEADRAIHRLHAVADQHHLVEAAFRASAVDAHLALADGHLAVADRAADELVDSTPPSPTSPSP